MPARSLLGLALFTLAGLGLAPSASAQSGTATLEFTVQAAPSGGRPEKVMRQTFYLLRQNLADIEKAARAETPPPDLGSFVEELNISPELKAWMKRHQTVKLQGEAFLKQVEVDDMMNVPEFRQAYVTRNQIMVGLGFPQRKAKPTDREKNPERWEKSEKRYWEEIRNYFILHPESKQGMDDHLIDITAAPEWRARSARYEEQVRQTILQLARTRYLAAQAETDYNGFVRLSGLPPGRYWLTNLWDEVRAGDVHLRWELPLELRPGQTLYLELNNANAHLPGTRP